MKPFGHHAAVLSVKLPFLCLCCFVIFVCKLKPFGHQAAVLSVKLLSFAVSFSQQFMWLNVKLGRSCKMLQKKSICFDGFCLSSSSNNYRQIICQKFTLNICLFQRMQRHKLQNWQINNWISIFIMGFVVKIMYHQHQYNIIIVV